MQIQQRLLHSESVFNNLNNTAAASNIEQPQKSAQGKWICCDLSFYLHHSAVHLMLFLSVRLKHCLTQTRILYLAFDIKVWLLKVCCPSKCLSLREG